MHGIYMHAHVVCPRWRKWKISHATAARACIHTCTCTCECELVCTSIHGYVIRSPEAACRGIGEYQLPDLVVNLASRIIFGSVWCVQVFIATFTVDFWQICRKSLIALGCITFHGLNSRYHHHGMKFVSKIWFRLSISFCPVNVVVLRIIEHTVCCLNKLQISFDSE